MRLNLFWPLPLSEEFVVTCKLELTLDPTETYLWIYAGNLALRSCASKTRSRSVPLALSSFVIEAFLIRVREGLEMAVNIMSFLLTYLIGVRLGNSVLLLFLVYLITLMSVASAGSFFELD